METSPAPWGHTPGPWYFWTDGDTCEVIPSEDYNETPLCTVERPSDAYLIAAAPDLLAALIELDAWALNESGAEYPTGTFEIVRAALAKAKGQ